MMTSRLNCNGIGLRVMGLFSLLVMMVHRSGATQFVVGGSKGWTVPSDNSAAYNQWAEKSRFQVGDSLLFVYRGGSDSVLQVTKDDYTNCNANSPISKFTDGHTDFKLDRSGPFYFISGNSDNCRKNEKLLVVVLADRTNKTTATASPPSPVAPAPSPVSQMSPPSPPPVEISPAPSTVSTKHKNGAGSVALGLLGPVGVLMGSSLIMGL